MPYCIYISRLSSKMMSILAIVFTFWPPHIMQAKMTTARYLWPDFGLNFKFDQLSSYILFHRYLDIYTDVIFSLHFYV